MAKKILQTLDDRILAILQAEAGKRGVSVQDLIRTVIIPEYLEKKGLLEEHSASTT